MVGGEVFCSGTLIANYMIVTAGHCVTPGPPDHAFFGSDPSNTASGFLLEVAQVSVHPDHNEDDLTNDIGVVLLKTAAPDEAEAARGFLEPRECGLQRARPPDCGFWRDERDGLVQGVEARRHDEGFDSVEDSSFKFLPSPSQTCNGDSGGPCVRDGGWQRGPRRRHLRGRPRLQGVRPMATCASTPIPIFINSKMTEYKASTSTPRPPRAAASLSRSQHGGAAAFAFAIALAALGRRRRR